jgi:hypothetical protein
VWIWEVRTIRVFERFVTGLCQHLKMMTIMTDLNFEESISYIDWHGAVGPTPAASTNILFIFNNLQQTSANIG